MALKGYEITVLVLQSIHLKAPTFKMQFDTEENSKATCAVITEVEVRQIPR